MSQLNEHPLPAPDPGGSTGEEGVQNDASATATATRRLDDSGESDKKPRVFEKGGGGWTVLAAGLGIVVMLTVTCLVGSNGGSVTGDLFINALAVTSVSIAGLGTILRAMAHGANSPFERQVDHAGKLMTVVALSSGVTGAVARLNATPDTLWAGTLVTLVVGGLLLAAAVVLGIYRHLRERSAGIAEKSKSVPVADGGTP